MHLREVVRGIYVSECSIAFAFSHSNYRYHLSLSPRPNRTSIQWRLANSLLLATLIRTALVVISYGAKVPAGIFVPSMAVGASFGRMVGIMVRAGYKAYPQSGIFAYCDPNIPACITPGTYAFLGAAAALR